jgi:hypothetical protein
MREASAVLRRSNCCRRNGGNSHRIRLNQERLALLPRGGPNYRSCEAVRRDWRLWGKPITVTRPRRRYSDRFIFRRRAPCSGDHPPDSSYQASERISQAAAISADLTELGARPHGELPPPCCLYAAGSSISKSTDGPSDFPRPYASCLDLQRPRPLWAKTRISP